MPQDYNSFEEKEASLKREVQTCRNVILFEPSGVKYHDPLSARALPNHRLMRTFGIDNSFTSTDQRWRQIFISFTKNRMKKATKLNEGTHPYGNWTQLQETAIGAYGDFLGNTTDSMKIVDLVQFVTLKVSLSYLFPEPNITSTGHAFEHIQYVSRRINELWILSKTTKSQTHDWSDETELQAALIAITQEITARMPGAFPMDEEKTPDMTDPLSPRGNPVNILLPAYETMWRVVLHCLMEVRFRKHSNADTWREILAIYLKELRNADAMSRRVFQAPVKNGISVMDIVKEALRLYPPTRRVHRKFDDHIVDANIELCQRSRLLGQDDPLAFRPERWQMILPELRDAMINGGDGSTKALKTAEESLGFMPFALRCAADTQVTRAFGMKMIALLVSVLAGGLGDEWEMDEIANISDVSVPLHADRQAYKDLSLRRRGIELK